MRWLLDENLSSPALIQFLRFRNDDVHTAPPGMVNSKPAALAREEKRVLLTHDKGFANIVAYPPDQYAGVVRIDIHPPRLKLVTEALTQLLAQVDPTVFHGRLITVDTGGFRLYPELPTRE